MSARAALLAVLLGAGLAPGLAGAAEPSRVAPGKATSACLGEASSARCAAETLIACLARVDRALCVRVGAAPADLPRETRLVEYVIERESVIRPDEVTDELRDVAWFKPGFVLVEAQLRACAPARATCDDEEWDDLQIYLRTREGRWEVVSWRTSSEPDRPGEIPEAFQPRSP